MDGRTDAGRHVIIIAHYKHLVQVSEKEAKIPTYASGSCHKGETERDRQTDRERHTHTHTDRDR